MSKTWKIVIGVLIGAVIITAIALPVLGRFVFDWDWAPWRDRMHQVYGVEVRGGTSSQLEIRLVDDDGDGVPDRGVIEAPVAGTWPAVRGFTGWMGLGHRLAFRPALGRTPLLGGLVRVALLALLIGGGIYLFRRWRRHPKPSMPAGPE